MNDRVEGFVAIYFFNGLFIFLASENIYHQFNRFVNLFSVSLFPFARARTLSSNKKVSVVGCAEVA